MKGMLKDSLESSPVVDRNGYPYFIHPLTDGVPRMDPSMLEEVLEWMLDVGDFDCDVILAPESMGLPLAVPLSLKLGIPYSILRKRSYGLPDEIRLDQVTGYSRSVMTINGVSKGDRVVIVDDVVSTGGTLDAIIQALDKRSVTVVDVLVPINKGTGRNMVLEKTGVTVKTMVNIRIDKGRVVCTD